MSEIQPGDRVSVHGTMVQLTCDGQHRPGECDPGEWDNAVVEIGNRRITLPLAALEPA